MMEDIWRCHTAYKFLVELKECQRNAMTIGSAEDVSELSRN